MAPTEEEDKAHFGRAAETYEDSFPVMNFYAAEAVNSAP